MKGLLSSVVCKCGCVSQLTEYEIMNVGVPRYPNSNTSKEGMEDGFTRKIVCKCGIEMLLHVAIELEVVGSPTLEDQTVYQMITDSQKEHFIALSEEYKKGLVPESRVAYELEYEPITNKLRPNQTSQFEYLLICTDLPEQEVEEELEEEDGDLSLVELDRMLGSKEKFLECMDTQDLKRTINWTDVNGEPVMREISREMLVRMMTLLEEDDNCKWVDDKDRLMTICSLGCAVDRNTETEVQGYEFSI